MEALPNIMPEDEDVVRPLTDRDHLSTFGWAWDDPDHVEDAS